MINSLTPRPTRPQPHPPTRPPTHPPHPPTRPPARRATGKSGWLRLYRHKELLASAMIGYTGGEEPRKIPWSKGTIAFRLARFGSTLLLATAGARVVLSRYDADAKEFVKLCVSPTA